LHVSRLHPLYDHLLAVAPTPVVALNRAIAIGELRGPVAALALVDELDLESYFASTRRWQICFSDSDSIARLPPPTSVRLLWRRVGDGWA
jgi:hypothetical protein